jgi:DNA/RNA endonuclease YhcR with UshA esterase domain
MKQILLSSIALLAFLCAGCDKSYDAPAEWTPVNMQPNMTIAELKALYKNGGVRVNAPDAVVAGKVISTDRYGNFYRSFYIQDETSGIEIKIGARTLYNTYKVGQEVYIKPHTLYLGAYGQLVSLGFPSTNPKYENGYIDAPMIINSCIFRGEMKTPADTVEISSMADITEDMMGTLVIIKNAVYVKGETQYSTAHPNTVPITTWAVKNEPDTPEDDAIYGLQTFNITGVEVIVRTSGYAKFAATEVPFAVGARVNITGVLTRYNATYQLALNTDKDVEVVP